jgi:hypothetical protein
MRIRVMMEYETDGTYQEFRDELHSMADGAQGLPGRCVYVALERVDVDVVKTERPSTGPGRRPT